MEAEKIYTALHTEAESVCVHELFFFKIIGSFANIWIPFHNRTLHHI